MCPVYLCVWVQPTTRNMSDIHGTICLFKMNTSHFLAGLQEAQSIWFISHTNIHHSETTETCGSDLAVCLYWSLVKGINGYLEPWCLLVVDKQWLPLLHMLLFLDSASVYPVLMSDTHKTVTQPHTLAAHYRNPSVCMPHTYSTQHSLTNKLHAHMLPKHPPKMHIHIYKSVNAKTISSFY